MQKKRDLTESERNTLDNALMVAKDSFLVNLVNLSSTPGHERIVQQFGEQIKASDALRELLADAESVQVTQAAFWDAPGELGRETGKVTS